MVVEGVSGGCEARYAEPGGERGEAVVVPVGVVGEGGCCYYGAEVVPGRYEVGCLLRYWSAYRTLYKHSIRTYLCRENRHITVHL